MKIDYDTYAKKKYLQHSRTFCTDKTAYSDINISWSPLITIKTFLIFWSPSLHLPRHLIQSFIYQYRSIRDIYNFLILFSERVFLMISTYRQITLSILFFFCSLEVKSVFFRCTQMKHDLNKLKLSSVMTTINL